MIREIDHTDDDAWERAQEAVAAALQEGLPPGAILGRPFALTRHFSPPLRAGEAKDMEQNTRTDINDVLALKKPGTVQEVIELIEKEDPKNTERILQKPTLSLLIAFMRDWVISARDGEHAATRKEEQDLKNRAMEPWKYLSLIARHCKEVPAFRTQLEGVLNGYKELGGASKKVQYYDAMNAYRGALREEYEPLVPREAPENGSGIPAKPR